QELSFSLSTAISVLDQVKPRIPAEEFERVVGRISFFVSSGLYGKSRLLKIGALTGQTLETFDLPKTYFAEGLSYFGEGLLLQLTWKSHDAFLYQYKPNFKQVQTLKNFNENFDQKEGWGVAYNENNSSIVVSDGSNKLYFLKRKFFSVFKTLSIEGETVESNKITFLNELEMIEGKIWANIWRSPYVLIIDPDGEYFSWLDISSIARKETGGVLNGVSYDKTQKRIWITGKNWSKIYEIRLLEK
ncbi:MAG: hypothetical protein CMP11_09610, partial [Zetaproteobacteria bacterium]|nr:hypothetical protein [Pseudobdellovibrionaceae bacterium]